MLGVYSCHWLIPNLAFALIFGPEAVAQQAARIQMPTKASKRSPPNTQVFAANNDGDDANYMAWRTLKDNLDPLYTQIPKLIMDQMLAALSSAGEQTAGTQQPECLDPHRALIIHFALWHQSEDSSRGFSLIDSQWYVYHTKFFGKTTQTCGMAQTPAKANGTDLLYQDKDALLVGVTLFEGTSGAELKTLAAASYKASATPDVAENVQNLGSLFSAITGVVLPGAGAAVIKHSTFVASAVVHGYRLNDRTKLPFFFNLSYNVSIPKPPSPIPGSPAAGAASGLPAAPGGANNTTVISNQQSSKSPATDCTTLTASQPCVAQETLRSDDAEVWDVSVGIPTPGVSEKKYTTSNLTAKASTKIHTDLYGFLDVYPFAKWRNKESPVPHLLVGLPLTSQPFYRPFFGAALNVTSWTGLQSRGFPLMVSIFGGIVYEKEDFVTGASPKLSLAEGRTVKAMFGIEVPVSSIVSKIGKSKANSSGGAKGVSNGQ